MKTQLYDRAIALDDFNRIGGCFFDNFVSVGHIPVKIKFKYEKVCSAKQIKKELLVDKNKTLSLKIHGAFAQTTRELIIKTSPTMKVIYSNEKDWDSAINFVCANFGPEAFINELESMNKDTGEITKWKRESVENGFRNARLVLEKIDNKDVKKINIKDQIIIAGDMVADKCSFGNFNKLHPVCKRGSH